MKINLLLLLFFLFCLAGCSKKEVGLSLSTGDIFQLDREEHTLRLGVQSNTPWTAMVDNGGQWCHINSQTGDSLIIRIAANLLATERDCKIVIKNSGEQQDIHIRQVGSTEEYPYRLPVIFHIFYHPGEVVEQSVIDRLLVLLREVNHFYSGANGTTVDMNLEFIPATCTPEGRLLFQAGINCVERTQENISPDDFENNKYGDSDWIWDPNRYINIILCYLHVKAINGASSLPYTPSQYTLGGLNVSDFYDYSEYKKYHAPAVLINRWHFYDVDTIPGGARDLTRKTLIHELGHYLGLLHAFSESEDVMSDYCDDTPDYNREAYIDWNLEHLEATYEEKIWRTDRNGNPFISTNMMDYGESLFTQFTPDQRKRVRHVLTYSPLIPGPKILIEITPEE